MSEWVGGLGAPLVQWEVFRLVSSPPFSTFPLSVLLPGLFIFISFVRPEEIFLIIYVARKKNPG